MRENPGAKDRNMKAKNARNMNANPTRLTPAAIPNLVWEKRRAIFQAVFFLTD